MYTVKDKTGDAIIVLSHVTCVDRTYGESTFDVYEDDNDTHTEVPIDLYDDFVAKLSEYIDRKG